MVKTILDSTLLCSTEGGQSKMSIKKTAEVKSG